jgi:IS5 family transposase
VGGAAFADRATQSEGWTGYKALSARLDIAHLLDHCLGLSGQAMEEALLKIVPMRQFVQLRMTGSLPDETTVLNFRHMLEKHSLALKFFDAVNTHLSCKGLMLKRTTIIAALLSRRMMTERAIRR